MCVPADSFILCSCDEESLESAEIYWELSRSNEGAVPPDSSLGVVGSFLPPEEMLTFDRTLPLRLDIERELNLRNCFDFEYRPYPGDTLTIAGKYKVSFVFADNGSHFALGQELPGKWISLDELPEDQFEMRAGVVESRNSENFVRGE